jgi:hypothetical protein
MEFRIGIYPGSVELIPLVILFNSIICDRFLLTIRETKIFEVYISPGIQFPCRLDERINEIIILLPPHTLLPQSKVYVVIQMVFIVCSAIKDNSQRAFWVDTSAEGSQDQLCHGN